MEERPSRSPQLAPIDYAPAAKRSRVVPVMVPAAIHFVLSVGLGLFAFSRTMSRFESASTAEQVAEITAAVLLLPALALGWFGVTVSGPASYLLFLADSLLWGLAFAFIMRCIHGLSRSRSS